MNTDWHVLVLGNAAGEHALAARFIDAAVRRGHRVVAWAIQGGGPHVLLARTGAELRPVPWPGELRRVLDLERPPLVIAATSLTCLGWLDSLAGFGGRLCTLDSSWLFWTSAVEAAYRGVDRFLVALPAPVLAAGFPPQGTPRSPSASVHARMYAAGWFEPPPQDVPKEQVFLYFGRDWTSENFPQAARVARAIPPLAERFPSLRWRYVGPKQLDWPECVAEANTWLDDAAFDAAVYGSKVVICHHGQVIIGKAAAAGASILAFAPGASFRGETPDHADREVHAFELAGVANALHGLPPVERIAARLTSLLEAPQAPSGVGCGGADRAVEEAERMVQVHDRR